MVPQIDKIALQYKTTTHKLLTEGLELPNKGVVRHKIRCDLDGRSYYIRKSSLPSAVVPEPCSIIPTMEMCQSVMKRANIKWAFHLESAESIPDVKRKDLQSCRRSTRVPVPKRFNKDSYTSPNHSAGSDMEDGEVPTKRRRKRTVKQRTDIELEEMENQDNPGTNNDEAVLVCVFNLYSKQMVKIYLFV